MTLQALDSTCSPHTTSQCSLHGSDTRTCCPDQCTAAFPLDYTGHSDTHQSLLRTADLPKREHCNQTQKNVLLWQLHDTSSSDAADVTKDRVMTQTVSHQSLATDFQVQSQASPCGICGGQSGIGTGFYSGTLVLPCQNYCKKCSILIYQSSRTLYTHINP